MKRALLIALAVVLVVLAAGLAWWLFQPKKAPTELVLYGNVDLREVDLAFNNSERIASVLVQEGDRVQKGQVLARADTNRLDPQVAQAGSILTLDNINTANARRQYERLRNLSDSSGGRGVSQQDVDNAKAALDTATARAAADSAQLMLLRQQLIDAQLVAPLDATVRTRIMEPGEIAAPQKPVFSLAIINPKWISVYVSETDLGKVHPGMVASVLVDSFPNRRFSGWVGFISPAAEFTPKNIETDDLRTSLVYEVRVFVRDPKDELRLGMPATAHLALAHTSAPSGTGNQQ